MGQTMTDGFLPKDEETDIIADGGTRATVHFPDDDIDHAIQVHDSDAARGAVLTRLAELQESFENDWSEHLDAIDDDNKSVVYEADGVMVIADHTRKDWNDKLEELDIDLYYRKILKTVHHKAAERFCDYSWTASDPFVVWKNRTWQLGEFHVERRMAQLATAADASEAAAMDYWSVEIKGRSQSEWARMVGKSQQTVSENIQKVKDGLGAELS